ncbi:hypothetical protein ALC57_18061 [Trachymyrmex cornetzi]|uniref:Uncharacterized protein n=1 Tax=Trachymyrmex cornetzi TaxID=471704 RepID=A0A151ISK7_9HYME|nr:hypothetical protein ALC57_18061 [Trachymyrmex cornetzi]
MAHLPKRAFSSAHSDDVLLTPTVIDFPAWLHVAERYPFVLSNVISPRPSVRVREYIFAQIYHRTFLTTRRRTRKSEMGRIRRKLLFRNFGHSGPAKCCDTEQTVNTVGRLGCEVYRDVLPMADLLTPRLRGRRSDSWQCLGDETLNHAVATLGAKYLELPCSNASCNRLEPRLNSTCTQ